MLGVSTWAFDQAPWYGAYSSTLADGTVVDPTWIFDGLNWRFAKAPNPTGPVSEKTFNGLLEGSTRASDKTRIDSAGGIATLGVNQFDRTYDPATLQPLGLLPEESRTNFLLNSGTPATQTVSLATGTYTLWVVGSGSCTPAAGTAVGTGFAPATAGTPDTFTITTAGTVTFTVSGSLTRFQCENGSNPTSYIPTAGSTVTRALDDVFTDDTAAISYAEGTFLLDGYIGDGLGVAIGTSGTNRFHMSLEASGPSVFWQGFTTTESVNNTAQTRGSRYKAAVAYTYDSGTGAITYTVYAKGVLIASGSKVIGSWSPTRLSIGRRRVLSPVANNMPIATVPYWPKALTGSELQRLTTL